MHTKFIFRKILAIIIIFLFFGIALLPTITTKEIKNTVLTDDFFQNTEEKFLEITCKIFSSKSIDEIKKNVSVDDLKVLDTLYKNDIEIRCAFIGRW